MLMILMFKQTGLKAILAVFSSAAVIALILRAYLMWENAKRDKDAGATLGESNESSEFSEIDENFTDRESRNFRYLL